MKVAVIGSGASAFAVVERLREGAGGSVSVTLVAPDPPRRAAAHHGKDPRTWTTAEWDETHRLLRQGSGPAFPPPRSHFGRRIKRLPTNDESTLGTSMIFGGLSEFWSTAMYPYRDEDFDTWPLEPEDLHPYYDWVGQRVGIAGAPDGLSRFFPSRWVNRPPVERPPLVDHLIGRVPEGSLHGYRVGAGTNRLALETRHGHDQACVYCGGCFYGCHRGSLFRPSATLRRLISAGVLSHWPHAATRLRRTSTGKTEVEAGGERRTFDLVFLCAGAVGSSALLMRSLGLEDEQVVVYDNEMFNFPVAYTGLFGKPYDDHFSISSGVVGAESLQDPSRYAHYLIAPLPAILFHYYVPKRLAKLFDWPTRIPKGRFLICQMYTGADSAIGHELQVNDEGLRTHVDLDSISDGEARSQIRLLKRVLRGTGFWVPPYPLSRVPTSYHYAGGFPFGDDRIGLGRDCAVWPGLHVADSTVFPASPAQQFTFTIMANAARVGDEALSKLGA